MSYHACCTSSDSHHILCMQFMLSFVQDNQTALHRASSSGHDEVVKILLEAKVAVNAKNIVSALANSDI